MRKVSLFWVLEQLTVTSSYSAKNQQYENIYVLEISQNKFYGNREIGGIWHAYWNVCKFRTTGSWIMFCKVDHWQQLIWRITQIWWTNGWFTDTTYTTKRLRRMVCVKQAINYIVLWITFFRYLGRSFSSNKRITYQSKWRWFK